MILAQSETLTISAHSWVFGRSKAQDLQHAPTRASLWRNLQSFTLSWLTTLHNATEMHRTRYPTTKAQMCPEREGDLYLGGEHLAAMLVAPFQPSGVREGFEMIADEETYLPRMVDLRGWKSWKLETSWDVLIRKIENNGMLHMLKFREFHEYLSICKLHHGKGLQNYTAEWFAESTGVDPV